MMSAGVPRGLSSTSGASRCSPPLPRASLSGRKAGKRGRVVVTAAAATAPPVGAGSSQLAQLSQITVLSIDTGDLGIIRKWSSTGLVSDATTNPLFISQAAQRGDEPEYAQLVHEAVAAARLGYNASGSGLPLPVAAHEGGPPSGASIDLAIDHLSVNLGKEILNLVPGFVSTEVDIRLSFEAAASEARARRIIQLYEAAGVPRTRVLIKLAGTWEGIQAARALESDGIRTNITLVFGFAQAKAAAQASATLISPFPGRVLEWAKASNPAVQTYAPAEDPGVVAVRRMYSYFRKHAYPTICMPASWRSSTGEDPLDEVRALAGTDRMTLPPPLLEALAASEVPLERVLSPETAAAACADGDAPLTEAEFRWELCNDGAATDKLAAGMRAFAADTARLVSALEAHPGWS